MGRNNHSYTEEQLVDYSEIKKNICQNMRIARKLAKMKIKDSAPALGIEPESMKLPGASSQSSKGQLPLYECGVSFIAMSLNIKCNCLYSAICLP